MPRHDDDDDGDDDDDTDECIKGKGVRNAETPPSNPTTK